MVVFLVLGLLTLKHENTSTGLKTIFRLGLGELSFFTLVNFIPRAPVSLIFHQMTIADADQLLNREIGLYTLTFSLPTSYNSSFRSST